MTLVISVPSGQRQPAFGDDPVDLVGDGDDVLAGPFLDRDVDGLAAVQAGPAGLLLEAVNDLGHVLQIDRLSVVGCQDQAVDFIRGGEFAGHPELKTAVAQADGAAGGVLVLAVQHLLQGVDGQAVVGQLFREDLNPDFPLQAAGDIDLQDPGNGLDIILQVIGDLLQAGQAAGAGQGKDDNGQSRKN